MVITLLLSQSAKLRYYVSVRNKKERFPYIRRIIKPDANKSER